MCLNLKVFVGSQKSLEKKRKENLRIVRKYGMFLQLNEILAQFQSQV